MEFVQDPTIVSSGIHIQKHIFSSPKPIYFVTRPKKTGLLFCLSCDYNEMLLMATLKLIHTIKLLL